MDDRTFAVALAAVFEPPAFFSWVSDEDEGVRAALVLSAFCGVLFGVAGAIWIATSGQAVGFGGAIRMVALSTVNTLIAAAVNALLYWGGARLFGSTCATFAAGLRLAAGLCFLELLGVLVPLAGFKLFGYTGGTAGAILALLYLLWFNGRGLIEGMEAGPAGTWTVGILLAVSLSALTIAVDRKVEEERASDQLRAEQMQALHQLVEQQERQREWQQRPRPTPAVPTPADAQAQWAAAREREAAAAAERARAENAPPWTATINSVPPGAGVMESDEDAPTSFLLVGRTPLQREYPGRRSSVQIRLVLGRKVVYETLSPQNSRPVVVLGE